MYFYNQLVLFAQNISFLMNTSGKTYTNTVCYCLCTKYSNENAYVSQNMSTCDIGLFLIVITKSFCNHILCILYQFTNLTRYII